MWDEDAKLKRTSWLIQKFIYDRTEVIYYKNGFQWLEDLILK